MEINAFRKIDVEFECYHSPVMYSADGCDKCKYEQSCYEMWLNYMNQNLDTLVNWTIYFKMLSSIEIKIWLRWINNDRCENVTITNWT